MERPLFNQCGDGGCHTIVSALSYLSAVASYIQLHRTSPLEILVPPGYNLHRHARNRPDM
jgi:hypothetical protein